MRTSVIACFCLAILVQTATAQLTLVPRIGFENPRGLVSINNNDFFAPVSSRLIPQAGARLDYKFKTGHGLFAGISTSNTITEFNFSNPETSFSDYFTSYAKTQLRLEAGYQFNTKPIFLGKNNSPRPAVAQKKHNEVKKECGTYKIVIRKSVVTQESNIAKKKSCGSYTRSYSCSDKNKTKTGIVKKVAPKTPMYVRLQPQLGMSFIPSPKNDFTSKMQNGGATYTYNGANWSSAFITGMGFEFGKGKTQLFQVNIQYLKGIGNLDQATLITQSGNKAVETHFASRASAWSLSFGLPLSLSKKPNARHKKSEKNYYERKKHCEQKQIRYRCGVRI